MGNVHIRFLKIHADAKLPEKAHSGDNCYDLFAVEDTIIPGCYVTSAGCDIGSNVVPVGIQVGYITTGFGFTIKPKSGLGFKAGLQPHLGEIDNGYRGSLDVKMYNFTSTPYTFKKGDKVAQIKIEKNYDVTVDWTDIVHAADRGDAGFGSSGK